MKEKETLYIRIGGFIAQHKWLYYLLNYTWGILLTFIGWIVFLFLRMTGKLTRGYKDFYGKKYYCFKKNHDYSFSIGTFVVITYSNNFMQDSKSIIHETGHSIQNALFGPLCPFIVHIPSAIRFWYRNSLIKKRKPLKTGYYDIWFEASASELGTYW